MFVLRLVLFLLPVLAAWVPTTAHAQNPDGRIVGYTPILTGDSTWWAYKYTDLNYHDTDTVMTADWSISGCWDYTSNTLPDSCSLRNEEFFIVSVKRSDSLRFEDGIYYKLYIKNSFLFYTQDSTYYHMGVPNYKELLGYVREDTARRKVFWRPKAWAGLDTTSAYLLLNYDLYQTGDTIREGVRATQRGSQCGGEFTSYECYETSRYQLSVRHVTDPILYQDTAVNLAFLSEWPHKALCLKAAGLYTDYWWHSSGLLVPGMGWSSSGLFPTLSIREAVNVVSRITTVAFGHDADTCYSIPYKRGAQDGIVSRPEPGEARLVVAYPNPASAGGQVGLGMLPSGAVVLELWSVSGQRLLRELLQGGGEGHFTLPATLPVGLYTLTLTPATGTTTALKLLVE